MFDEMTHRNTTSKVAPNENKKQLPEQNIMFVFQKYGKF